MVGVVVVVVVVVGVATIFLRTEIQSYLAAEYGVYIKCMIPKCNTFLKNATLWESVTLWEIVLFLDLFGSQILGKSLLK